MQRYERGRAGRREEGVEIETVHVHDIDVRSSDHSGNGLAHGGLSLLPHGIVDEPARFRRRDLDEFPVYHRPRAAGHDRAVTMGHEGAVQRGQDLLRAAHGVGADRNKGIARAENRKLRGLRSPSGDLAAALAGRITADHAGRRTRRTPRAPWAARCSAAEMP